MYSRYASLQAYGSNVPSVVVTHNREASLALALAMTPLCLLCYPSLLLRACTVTYRATWYRLKVLPGLTGLVHPFSTYAAADRRLVDHLLVDHLLVDAAGIPSPP